MQNKKNTLTILEGFRMTFHFSGETFFKAIVINIGAHFTALGKIFYLVLETFIKAIGKSLQDSFFWLHSLKKHSLSDIPETFLKISLL